MSMRLHASTMTELAMSHLAIMVAILAVKDLFEGQDILLGVLAAQRFCGGWSMSLRVQRA